MRVLESGRLDLRPLVSHAWLTGKGLTVAREIVLNDDVAAAIIDYTIRTRADLVAICG